MKAVRRCAARAASNAPEIDPSPGPGPWFGVVAAIAVPAPHQHPETSLQQGPRMSVERTLSIIKPDAVAKNAVGRILSRFEAAGLKIVAARMMHLSRADAEAFYGVHRERPFFRDLVEFMISGPIMVQVLEGEGAIARNRELMGATDPKKAAAGTIRADFADSIDANAVHGSDGPDTARAEVAFFFPAMAVHSR
jgi:nucleoside-diphosphate kinase